MGSLSIFHWLILLSVTLVYVIPAWKIVSKAGYPGVLPARIRTISEHHYVVGVCLQHMASRSLIKAVDCGGGGGGGGAVVEVMASSCRRHLPWHRRKDHFRQRQPVKDRESENDFIKYSDFAKSLLQEAVFGQGGQQEFLPLISDGNAMVSNGVRMTEGSSRVFVFYPDK